MYGFQNPYIFLLGVGMNQKCANKKGSNTYFKLISCDMLDNNSIL